MIIPIIRLIVPGLKLIRAIPPKITIPPAVPWSIVRPGGPMFDRVMLDGLVSAAFVLPGLGSWNSGLWNVP